MGSLATRVTGTLGSGRKPLGQRIKQNLTLHNVAVAIGVAMALFHLYTGVFGTLHVMRQLSVHLIFVLVLTYLIYPAVKGGERRRLPIYDILLILLSLASLAYIVVFRDYVAFQRFPFVTPVRPIEMVLGTILILLILEAARRVVGLFLTLVAAAFILYVFIGQYLPGLLHHPPLRLDMLLDAEYLTTAGIFGIPLRISATYIVLFIIFGTFMMQTGFGEFLTDVATGITGRTRGGTAKVAVLSSAMFGTISGSSSANVAITGSFTIPMMKRTGFPAHFAGGVEAASSVGGQIMPPIMGAAAFIMPIFIGVPYVEIIKHAAIPALLYFTAIFFMVDFEAAKRAMKGLSKEEIPPWKGKILTHGHMIIPIIILLYFLATGRTLFFAITVSIGAVFVFSFLRKATRFNLKRLITALYEGARGTVIVGVATATAGIIIGTLQITGLDADIVLLLVELSGGYIIIGLVLTMFIAIILGMGMPTTAAYVLMAALVTPALERIGVPTLQAHFFVFYFAMVSLVTPPVAVTAYVAAGIARSSMTRTGFTAAMLAGTAYIVPFMFVFDPALLLIGSPGNIVLAVITALIGVFALAMGLQGWGFIGRLNPIFRIIAFGTAILMLWPGWLTDIFGAVLLGVIYLGNRFLPVRQPPSRL